MKTKIRSGIVGLLLLMLITGVVVPAIGTADDSIGNLHLSQIFSLKPIPGHGTDLAGGNDGKSEGGSSGTDNGFPGFQDGIYNRVAGLLSSGGSGSGRGGEGSSGGGGNSYVNDPAGLNNKNPGSANDSDGGMKDTGNISPGHDITSRVPAVAVPEFPDLFIPVAGLIGLVGLVFRMRD